MIRRHLLFVACAFAAAAAGAAEPDRGQLLYETHCIACHNEQVHWRKKKAAKNWTKLVAEVNRWQENGNLGWDDGDISAVARYLNMRYYRFRVAAR